MLKKNLIGFSSPANSSTKHLDRPKTPLIFLSLYIIIFLFEIPLILNNSFFRVSTHENS